jgi:transcriptional regulator with GAF, ATPase, and Fis domain
VDQRRSERFAAALAGTAEGEPFSLATVCRAIMTLLPISGAAMVLMSDRSTQGVASATDELTRAVQSLEFTLGEGPGIDAFSQIEAVGVDDLDSATSRWSMFAPAVANLGVGSIYSLPLRSGGVAMGILTLWSDRPGALDEAQKQDALLVAELVAQVVLTMQDEATSESLAWPLDLSDHRMVVHQATGMISAQLNCAVGEALVRLRAYAYGTGLPIDGVAEEVIQRRLRFDER